MRLVLGNLGKFFLFQLTWGEKGTLVFIVLWRAGGGARFLRGGGIGNADGSNFVARVALCAGFGGGCYARF